MNSSPFILVCLKHVEVESFHQIHQLNVNEIGETELVRTFQKHPHVHREGEIVIF